MAEIIQTWVRGSRALLMASCFVLVLVVGLLDYLTGLEFSIDVFYLIPIVLAVWFAGRWYGMAFSVGSAATSFTVNGLPKAQGANLLVVSWNALILLVFYLVVVWILDRWRALHRQLETRVQERTAALQAEIGERERLEKEVLHITEREQQRIGRDLHDSLCQHLTATALAGKVLEEQLGPQPASAAAAQRVVGMIEEGIILARNLAHGLMPVELEAAGLMEAFEELVEGISEQFHIVCEFTCEAPVLIPEASTATHLYRIAQEAISNAIKHGYAKHIEIQLSKTESGTVVEITDDGVGLPDPLPANRGMGLRIMAHRALMIGGSLTVRRGTDGGTVVTCILP